MGKLYGGILIHENWRNTKFSSIDELRKQEEEMEEIERQEALKAAEHAVTENADRGSSYEVKTIFNCNPEMSKYLPPLYLHLIFPILQFEISSWIFFQF